jgi:tetratricopeptide (TPR) repeat protein
MHQPHNARADLQAALALEDADASQYTEMAIAANMDHDYISCVKYMDLALKATDAEEGLTDHGHVVNGRCRLSVGRIADAIDSLQRAAKMNPNNFDAWLNLGLSETFNAHIADHKRAEEAFTRAIAVNPAHLQAAAHRAIRCPCVYWLLSLR